jgi:transposase
LFGEHVSGVQTVRDLLECVWPAALEAAKHLFRSATWVAALTVVVRRDGGDLNRIRRLGSTRFERAVRAEVVRRGGVRPCLRIVRRLFAALTDTAGVLAHPPAVFERLE